MSNERRASYENAIRIAGHPDFHITERAPDGRLVPARRRDEYFPVYANVPEHDDHVFGFDTGLETGALLDRSRDTGRMLASSPFRLLGENNDHGGIVVVAPVYAIPLKATTTREERRAGLVGFAHGVFRIEGMIESILGKTTVARGFDHYLFDGPNENPDHLIYVHASRARTDRTQAPPFQQLAGAVRFRNKLTFIDRTWTLVTVPLHGGLPDFPDQPTAMLLGACLLATAVVSLSFLETIRRTAYLQSLTRDLEVTTQALRDEMGERQKTAEQIIQMARHDGLTGLANRRVFVEAVQQAIARARRGASFAVLYLDLDHFKDINDTLGHPIGDRLLQSVAERLRELLRETDLAARFGGDEFAVLAADIADPTDAGLLAEKLLKIFAKPFAIEGNEIRAGTSIGIAVFDPDSPTADLLLSHADVALYRAKSEGRGTYRFFTDEMDVEVRSRVILDGELQEAIARRQFFLVYQPEVEIETGRITGVEALVRWQHPSRGVVGPDEFVPAAEKNGLIVVLTRVILRQACEQARRWLDAGIAPPVIAVNLSAVCFKRPFELKQDIEEALADTGLPPRMLEVELTETALMHTARDHIEMLLDLRARGVRVAIDDFGTGYSSLDYLRRFPVDRIKIAQDFVADIGAIPGNAMIVRAAIDLAHALNIGVIAEGVELEEQLRLLRSWNCREVQGFYFAEPLTVEAVTPLLRCGQIAPHPPVEAETAA